MPLSAWYSAVLQREWNDLTMPDADGWNERNKGAARRKQRAVVSDVATFTFAASYTFPNAQLRKLQKRGRVLYSVCTSVISSARDGRGSVDKPDHG